jgi:hypothetical protein
MLLTAATVPVVRLVTTGDNFEEERIVFEQAIHEDFNSFLPKHIIKTVMFRSGTISEGMPIYLIERINTSTGKAFNDGEHIIYINGAYNNENDTSDLAKLIHDFRCSKGEDMLLAPFADKTKFFKETQEGVERMCKVMEDRVNDERVRQQNAIAVKLLKIGILTNEQIAEATGLTVERVKEIEASLDNIPA